MITTLAAAVEAESNRHGARFTDHPIRFWGCTCGEWKYNGDRTLTSTGYMTEHYWPTMIRFIRANTRKEQTQ